MHVMQKQEVFASVVNWDMLSIKTIDETNAAYPKTLFQFFE